MQLHVDSNYASPHAKLSLTHRVPTLVDDDSSLSESSAIAEYLHEAYPGQALCPSDLNWVNQERPPL